jgi:putative MATE family efflux protein
MQDLTHGSIPRHLITQSVPIAVGMAVQTLYYLVDIYFVAQLGGTVLAGVSAAGSLTFVVLALTQMLSVGTVALIAPAVGRKDKAGANLVFNQSVALSALCGALTLLGGYTLGEKYLHAVGVEAESMVAGMAYLRWYIPGMALQFALAAMGAALRGTGVVKPTMIVQMITVLANVILAPILIAGWGTGHPMGAAGAGLATTLSVVIGVAMMVWYFVRLEHYVAWDGTQIRPRPVVWKQMLNLGLPAGGEFLLMFVYMAVIYSAISSFGAEAQAGFGLATRIMQAVFLPALAIAFAVPALGGQNMGARKADRVRETIRAALLIECSIMVLLTFACQAYAVGFLRPFTNDAAVIAVGVQFLEVVSWNFVFSGVNFACSGMFQALGNTWPALFSTATRLVTFVFPVLWLSRQPGFEIVHVWYLSVATMTLQGLLSLTLLRLQMQAKLEDLEPHFP